MAVFSTGWGLGLVTGSAVGGEPFTASFVSVHFTTFLLFPSQVSWQCLILSGQQVNVYITCVSQRNVDRVCC